MLQAIKLSKAFEGKPVIRDFSLTLEPCGRYCLMGPSGCGKTTALRLLSGLIKPDSGELRGLDQVKPSVVFQENRLLEQLSAIGNVQLVSKATDQEIAQILIESGLEQDSLPQPVSAFSGGMKRRVALCRALMAEYDILFMDEPYKGLDDATKAKVMAVVTRLTQGKTVLLVTHDAREAEGYHITEMQPF